MLCLILTLICIISINLTNRNFHWPNLLTQLPCTQIKCHFIKLVFPWSSAQTSQLLKLWFWFLQWGTSVLNTGRFWNHPPGRAAGGVSQAPAPVSAGGEPDALSPQQDARGLSVSGDHVESGGESWALLELCPLFCLSQSMRVFEYHAWSASPLVGDERRRVTSDVERQTRLLSFLFELPYPTPFCLSHPHPLCGLSVTVSLPLSQCTPFSLQLCCLSLTVSRASYSCGFFSH